MISFVIAEGGRLAFTYFPAYTGVKQASELMSSCGALAHAVCRGKVSFHFIIKAAFLTLIIFIHHKWTVSDENCVL